MNEKKRRKTLLAATFLLVATLLMLAAPARAGRLNQVTPGYPWDFERFNAAITINTDSTIRVRETQIANFGGSFHFLNRDLTSAVADFSEGRTYGRVRYTDIKVYDLSGAPYSNWKVEKLKGGKRVHIEFSAFNEQKGWIIEYTMSGAIIYAKDYDRLYFNTVSVQRDVPIKTSRTTVTLPVGTDMSKVRDTAYPSTTNPPAGVQSGREGNMIWWETATIHPYTTLTVDVSFPKGIVKVPLVFRAGFGAVIIALCAIIFLLIAGGMILLWSRKGRDIDAPALDVVQYDAPAGLRPAEVGMLLDESPRTSDITATIVDLAVRGKLVIIEQEGGTLLKHKEFSFQRKDPGTQDLAPFENDVMSGLFESGDLVTQDDLTNEFYTHVPGITLDLRQQVLAKNFWDGDPSRVKRRYFMIAVLLLLLIAPVWYAQTWFDLGYLIALIPTLAVCGLWVGIVGHFMPRRSKEGAQAYSYVMGFKDYLSTAEKEELKFMTPEHFQANLPYAMVLGVVRQWTGAFQSIFTSPPDWYQGYYGGAFTTVYLADSLIHMQTSVTSTLTSSPSSSGSGGGGGFGGGSSGGGFGGGGSSAG